MKTLLAGARIALRSIARARARAALTVLGILIGIAAVVIVVALGTGVRNQVDSLISTLGTNIVFVFPRPSSSPGAKRIESVRLKEKDVAVVLNQAPSVANATPYSSIRAQVTAESANAATLVEGVWRSYFSIRGYQFASGTAWTDADEVTKAKVCVIGETTRRNLFGEVDPIGRVVRIGSHPFRVVGLLAPKGQIPLGEDQDDVLLMPSGSFRMRIAPAPAGRTDEMMISATDERTTARAGAQVEAILRERLRIDPEDEFPYRILSQSEVKQTQLAVFDTLTALLSSIAAVSLVVGGIGVMNIMLVSVAERTREIGIRMAIGAREIDILVQFLLEAVALCLVGGLFGIALGAGALRLITSLANLEMVLPLRAIAAALATSGTIGIAFGFFPARRAARLDPISSLRHE